MSRTTAQVRDYGERATAAAAAALAGTGPRCGALEQRGDTTYVCLMPPHRSNSPHVEEHRRRKGESVHADRHYFTHLSNTRSKSSDLGD